MSEEDSVCVYEKQRQRGNEREINVLALANIMYLKM